MGGTTTREAAPSSRALESQEEYEQLPTAPWFEIQGRIIPNHPELPEHLRNLQPTPPDIVQRVIRRAQRNRRQNQRQKALEAPLPQRALAYHLRPSKH